VSVVSVMAVNNETGVISDLAGVADLLAARSPGTALHCDAVQAMSWIDTASLGQWCDAISISAHKFGGPKGVGALLLGPQVTVNAQILGGGQEQERRSGTQNVAGIVAMAVAASVTAVRRVDTIARVACQRDRLVTGLQDRLDGVHVTVTEAPIAAGHAHVCIEGIESEAVLFLADRAGVAASAGSSCASGAVTLSHVLAAMGVEPERGRGALRFTLGHTTSAADVDHAVSVVTDAVTRLRSR
jgi:cysteine desulfurase